MLAASLAFATARIAIGLGVAADALFHDGIGAVSFSLWLAMVCAGVIAMVGRADLTLRRESFAWLATAVGFAAASAWRDSDMLQFANTLACLLSLGIAAATIQDDRLRTFATRIANVLWALARLAIGTVAGLLPFVARDFRDANIRGRWTTSTRPIVRVIVVVAPLAVVFGSLLLAADPFFASFVAVPKIDVGPLVSHLLLIGFFSWILAGAMRSTLLGVDQWPRAGSSMRVELGLLETTAGLTTLNVLFGAFVAAQLGWLFGGERLLQARTGLTAAEYARQGFFQTVWVVVLVVPLLVATRAALRADPRVVRRHTALSLPVIGLVGAIIVSAVLRMRLYVHYYGMSTDRLCTLVFMTWLGVVLAWLAVTVLRKREGWFAGGSAVSGLFVLALMNVASPDLIVARVNIDRALDASAPTPLDLSYLATLSGEAVPLVTAALLEHVATPLAGGATASDNEDSCMAAHELLQRWGPTSGVRARLDEPAAWRWWNAGERTAVRTVAAHAHALWPIAHSGCARPTKAAAQR